MEDDVHDILGSTDIVKKKKTPQVSRRKEDNNALHIEAWKMPLTISAANAPQSASPHGEYQKLVRLLIFRFVTIRTITCSSQSLRRYASNGQVE